MARIRSGGGARPGAVGKGQAAAAPRPGGAGGDHDHILKCWAAAGAVLPAGKTSWRKTALAPGLRPGRIVSPADRADAKGLHVNDRATRSSGSKPPPAQPPAAPAGSGPAPFQLSRACPGSRGAPAATRAMRGWAALGLTRSGVATTICDPLLRQGWIEHVPEVAARHRDHSSGGVHRAATSFGVCRIRAQQRASFCFIATGELAGQTIAKGLQEPRRLSREPRRSRQSFWWAPAAGRHIAQVLLNTEVGVRRELLGVKVANSLTGPSWGGRPSTRTWPSLGSDHPARM